jgi:hypothetical protein
LRSYDLRVKLRILTALVAVLGVFLPGGATGEDGLSLRGYGTATVDGVLGPGEWDTAGRYDFSANRAPAEGGGTVPATLYVMNDGANLYLALRVSVTSLGYSAFDAVFLASPPNVFGTGNDVLRTSPASFEDLHFHFVPPNTYPWLADQSDGGTIDGTGLGSTHGQFSVFEVAHPLDSADDSHDFSLAIAKHVRFVASFHHCLDSCVSTSVPGSGFGEVVAVSGTHVPPDTTITGGPRDRAEVRRQQLFEFTGSDDVVGPPDLTFECKVDAEEWSSCESPVGDLVDDGRHTFSVRALDDMLNADPTPARRSWRVDTKSPSRPSVRGPRLSTTLSPVYRFSSRDAGTASSRIRFRCAFDTKRLHVCSTTYHRRLTQGRHVLRIRAVDPAGNESGTTTVRIVSRVSA